VPYCGIPVPCGIALALRDPHARLTPGLAAVPGAGFGVKSAPGQGAVAVGAVLGHGLILWARIEWIIRQREIIKQKAHLPVHFVLAQFAAFINFSHELLRFIFHIVRAPITMVMAPLSAATF
jgi:hypothetical protein